MTTPRTDSPGVLVWPPLLYGFALLAGVVLHLLLPLSLLVPLPSRIAGAILIGIGVALARWGERTMHQAGTNVHPSKPALVLVEAGPFRFTRNPLYLSLTLLYVGVALMIPAVWPLVLLLPVLLVMRWGIIAREERYLERKFGSAYRRYRDRVRRWL